MANRRAGRDRHADGAAGFLDFALARTGDGQSLSSGTTATNEPAVALVRACAFSFSRCSCCWAWARFCALWWVQVAHGPEWTAKIRGSSEATVRIPSVRGEIRDRNGVTLVQNRASYEVDFYLPEMVKGYRERVGRRR